MTENAVHGQTPAIETEAELAKLGEATTFGLNRRTVQIVFLIGIAFSAWQIYTAAYAPFSSQVMRSVHVGFLMLMAFLVYRVTRDHTRANVPWYDWLLAGAGFLLAFYHWIFEIQLIQTSGDPSLIDLIVGAVVVLILFEAARRIMGYALPLICLSFIVYALIGRSLPAPFGHRGYDIPHILERLFLGTEGIYGIPTLVSSTYI
ncbi:MAG: TRAP transporter permease, partial [Rhodospirillales bacterium]